MRPAQRWLLYLISVVFLLLLIGKWTTYPESPKTPLLNSGLRTDGYDRPKPTTIDSIEALWTHWSTVLDRVRPEVGAIKTRGAAGSAIPKDENGFRTPYKDLVVTDQLELDVLTNSHADFVEELSKDVNQTGLFEGTGLVMVGGGEYFGPAIIGLQMLRRSGSTLPVEIFVADREEYNPRLCEEYLPKLDARCLVLSDYLSAGHPGLKVTHYQLKALAMLFSSFENVLLSDSDSMPLVDPAQLFDSEAYNRTGLVIWPDFWTATESPKFYKVAGLAEFPSNLPKTSCETGQILLNKRIHLKTLLLATYYNVYGPGYYYPLLSQGSMGEGDKETFMAAAVVLNASYHRVHTPVKAVGRFNGLVVKGSAMVQSHPVGLEGPAFLHANTPKMNAGHLVDEGDLFSYDHTSHIRMLGTEGEQQEMFGLDLEKTIWELLVQTGCELASVIREWKRRDRLCERLEEHYKTVFVLGDVRDLPRHPLVDLG